MISLSKALKLQVHPALTMGPPARAGGAGALGMADTGAAPVPYPMLRKVAPDMSRVPNWQQRRLLNIPPRLPVIWEDRLSGAFRREVSSGARASGEYAVPRNWHVNDPRRGSAPAVSEGLASGDQPSPGPVVEAPLHAVKEPHYEVPSKRQGVSPYTVLPATRPVVEPWPHTDEEPHYAVPSNRLAPELGRTLRLHFEEAGQAQQRATFGVGVRLAFDHLPSLRNAGRQDTIETREPPLPVPPIPRARVPLFNWMGRKISQGGEPVWGGASRLASGIASHVAASGTGLSEKFHNDSLLRGPGETFLTRLLKMPRSLEAETMPSPFQRYTHKPGWRKAKNTSLLSRREMAKRDEPAEAIVRAPVQGEQKEAVQTPKTFVHGWADQAYECMNRMLIDVTRTTLVLLARFRRR